MNESRACAVCGKTFAARRPESRYCSPACYGAAYGAALSLADLETQGHVFGTGSERRARCPLCGDEPHASDPNKLLRVNVDKGTWQCSSCGAAGKLREHWTPPDGADPLRPKRAARPRPAPRSAPPAAPPETAADRERRAVLRRLWTAAAPIDAPEAEPGAAYLEGRALPVHVAARARVRFAADWYGRPAVVAPVQDERGRMLAAEGRYTDGGTTPKGRTCGPKSGGVFVATPGALDVSGVTLCEGPLTALSVAACGFAAVALCGQTAPPWLARRLALHDVVIALDEGETKTEAAAAALVRALAAYGARPYRLRLPARVDVNDRLRAVGLDTLRAELDAAICGALSRP